MIFFRLFMSVGTLKLPDIPEIFDVRARKQQAQSVQLKSKNFCSTVFINLPHEVLTWQNIMFYLIRVFEDCIPNLYILKCIYSMFTLRCHSPRFTLQDLQYRYVLKVVQKVDVVHGKRHLNFEWFFVATCCAKIPMGF